MRITLFRIITIFLCLGMFSCFGTQQSSQKANPPYQPSYSFSSSSSKPGQKVDVSIGLIAPQFTGDGVDWWRDAKSNDEPKSMIRALRSSFGELLISKGFTTSGPFNSLSDMTFPEKKGANLVMFPQIDISETYRPENVRKERRHNVLTGTQEVSVCNIVMQFSGSVQLVVLEPITEQKMWVKRIEVSTEKKNFPGEGNQICSGQATTREIKNQYLKSLENIYMQVMKNLDRYVNAEEFNMLKAQAVELREKKSY